MSDSRKALFLLKFIKSKLIVAQKFNLFGFVEKMIKFII